MNLISLYVTDLIVFVEDNEYNIINNDKVKNEEIKNEEIKNEEVKKIKFENIYGEILKLIIDNDKLQDTNQRLNNLTNRSSKNYQTKSRMV